MIVLQLCLLIGFSLVVAGVAFALHVALRRYTIAVVTTGIITVGLIAILRATKGAATWEATDALVLTFFGSVAMGISALVGIPPMVARRKAREQAVQGFQVQPVEHR